MNAIRTINLTKQVLLVSFIFFTSCQKQTDMSAPTQKSLSDNAFFSRAKISANQSDRDLVDTIIDFCKRADDISHFSKAVMEKYGYPKWDLTLTLNNENGLKSLMVPVVDTSNQVKLIIFAYQDTKDHVIFKFVGRNTPQPGLPVTTNNGKTLTKESLVGIFNALDKRVAASKIQQNSSMENVKTNNTYISSLCWLITWHYDDGEVGVLNSQCSYQIIITPGNAKGGLAAGQIGVVEDIQIGDSGGGGELETDNADIAFLYNIANNGFICSDLIKSNEVVETNDSRIKEYEWRAFRNGLWALYSFDQGSHKKISTSDMPTPHWEWEHLEHKSIGAVGVIPAVSVDYKELTSLPTIGRFYSLMNVKFEITYKFVSSSGPILTQFVYGASHPFNVND